MSKNKRALQLGMNHSTAQNRLVKDILWDLIEFDDCYRCGKPMTRSTFSIEHMVPWLDSDDPIRLFFDVGNIAFSHQSCNSSAARRTRPCRTSEQIRTDNAAKTREKYIPEKRHQKYLLTGY